MNEAQSSYAAVAALPAAPGADAYLPPLADPYLSWAAAAAAYEPYSVPARSRDAVLAPGEAALARGLGDAERAAFEAAVGAFRRDPASSPPNFGALALGHRQPGQASPRGAVALVLRALGFRVPDRGLFYFHRQPVPAFR